MQARFLSEDEYPQWDELVAESAHSCVFDESHWFSAIADVTQRDACVAAVLDNDGVILGGAVLCRDSRFGLPAAGLLPLCHTNTSIVGRFPDGSKSKRGRHLLSVCRCLAEFLKEEFAYVVLTNHVRMSDVRAFRWQGWRSHVLYSYIIRLPSLAFEDLGKSLRKHIRHAERCGVQVVDGASPRDAHGLLTRTGERQGFVPSVSEDELAALKDRLGEKLRMRMAVKGDDGRPLAALITKLDEPRSTVYALVAGFDAAYTDLHATSLLHWREMEDTRDLGIETFDFVGGDVESNVQFKAGFAGDPTPYLQVSYATPKYRVLNALAKRLPW